MEQPTKRESTIFSLVSQFESMSPSDNLDSFDVKSFVQLISHYERESMFEIALDVADIAISNYSNRNEFYIIKSRILLELGILDQCISYLDKAQSITPNDISIQLLKAKAISQLGNEEEALALLEPLKDIVNHDDLMEIQVTEAYIYDMMGDYIDVVERLRPVLNHNPMHDEALQILWNSLDMHREYELSIEITEELLDLNPYNYMAWYILGQSCAAEGEYSKAIDAMEYSYLINSDFETAYLECADLCMDMCRYAQALSIYKEHAYKFGVNTEVQVLIAKCQVKLSNYTAAKLNLLKAVKKEKSNDEIHFLLGQCYSKDGNWYKAVSSYHKAINIDDSIEDYFLALAKAFVEVEDYNKATINFQEAADLAPHCDIIWTEYISFLIRLGLYEESDQLLEEAFCYAYGGNMLYCHAIVSFFLKDQKKGLSLLEEALTEDFEAHKMIFTLAPELEVDKDIMAMIRYFKGEHAYQEAY